MFLLAQESGNGWNRFLFVLCIVLFIALTTTLTLYIISIVRTRRRNAEAAAKNEGETDDDPNVIPEDVLIAVLTAAAATVYGETKPKFRVVSFRRISR